MKAGSNYCSRISAEENEPLHGTASTFSSLILVEYNEAFKENAIEESGLPPQAVNLFSQLNKYGCRTLLIKQNSSKSRKHGYSVFRIRMSEGSALIAMVKISDYGEIDGNLFAQFQSTERELSYSESMYLVCVNGKKDLCCAKYGLPVYDELRKYSSENVWMCSHVGGDRFAPSIVHIPSFSYYGRIQVNDIKEFVATTENGKIYMPRYRGRSTFSFKVQSADYFLRKYLGVTKIDDITFVSQENLPEQSTMVRFRTQFGLYQVIVQTCRSNQKVLFGCSTNRVSNYYYQELVSIVNVRDWGKCM